MRKNFGGMGKLWNPLSDWLRQLWDEEGATKKTRKRLGQSWPMTGWNYFVRANQRRLNRGLPPLQFPPEYLQRLEAALAAALACANAAQPLLGPALFLQANRSAQPGNQSPVRSLASLPPPA